VAGSGACMVASMRACAGDPLASRGSDRGRRASWAPRGGTGRGARRGCSLRPTPPPARRAVRRWRRDLGVRARLARGDGADGAPDPVLERCPGHVRRHLRRRHLRCEPPARAPRRRARPRPRRPTRATPGGRRRRPARRRRHASARRAGTPRPAPPRGRRRRPQRHGAHAARGRRDEHPTHRPWPPWRTGRAPRGRRGGRRPASSRGAPPPRRTHGSPRRSPPRRWPG
jgi:hypothetical protein